MLPAALQALVDQIAACEAEAERLLHGLDDDAVNRVPPGGGWSVAQCLTHLVLMNDFYLRGWPEAVRAAVAAQRGSFRGLHPTLPGRWFVRAMEPPYRMKGKAVAATQPTAPVPRQALLPSFVASHDTYRALVRDAAAVDVNRVVAPNAILPAARMRLATVLLLIPAHDRRHLWQAANVRRSTTPG